MVAMEKEKKPNTREHKKVAVLKWQIFFPLLANVSSNISITNVHFCKNYESFLKIVKVISSKKEGISDYCKALILSAWDRMLVVPFTQM